MARVYYPGLTSDPGYAVASRQMRQPGGMLSFDVHGGREQAFAMVNPLKLVTRATSLGGPETLIEHRASVEGEHTRAPESLLRVSIGLEHPDDLIEDFAQALDDQSTAGDWDDPVLRAFAPSRLRDCVALLSLSPALAAAEPLRLHPQNPHYFLFRGKPAVLVTSGEHYGAVLNLDFKHDVYLDTLAADGLNLTRVFVGSYLEKSGDFTSATTRSRRRPAARSRRGRGAPSTGLPAAGRSSTSIGGTPPTSRASRTSSPKPTPAASSSKWCCSRIGMARGP